ncbi:MT-A70 family methyltransferase [Planctomycetota bacterium]
MNREPRELALLSRAEKALAEANTIDEIKEIRDKAEAVKAYAKKARLSRDIVLLAASIKVRAERKLGQILQKTLLADLSPGNQHSRRSHRATSPIRLKDLRITKSDSSRAQQISRLPKAVFDRHVADCIDSGTPPTTAGLLRLAKQREATENVPPTPPSVPGFVTDLQSLIDQGKKYSTIYADPPWKHENQASRGATDNHYPTMTIAEICSQPVAQLAADNAHLHLWTTSVFLREAFEVIEAWGFKYACSSFVWVKPQLGLGNFFRSAHELILLGIRGKLPFLDKGQRSWLEAERTSHSRKPEAVREIIEKVSPGPYLEMYGRRPPIDSAWTVFGNQLTREKSE